MREQDDQAPNGRRGFVGGQKAMGAARHGTGLPIPWSGKPDSRGLLQRLDDPGGIPADHGIVRDVRCHDGAGGDYGVFADRHAGA